MSEFIWGRGREPSQTPKFLSPFPRGCFRCVFGSRLPHPPDSLASPCGRIGKLFRDLTPKRKCLGSLDTDIHELPRHVGGVCPRLFGGRGREPSQTPKLLSPFPGDAFGVFLVLGCPIPLTPWLRLAGDWEVTPRSHPKGRRPRFSRCGHSRTSPSCRGFRGRRRSSRPRYGRCTPRDCPCSPRHRGRGGSCLP